MLRERAAAAEYESTLIPTHTYIYISRFSQSLLSALSYNTKAWCVHQSRVNYYFFVCTLDALPLAQSKVRLNHLCWGLKGHWGSRETVVVLTWLGIVFYFIFQSCRDSAVVVVCFIIIEMQFHSTLQRCWCCRQTRRDLSFFHPHRFAAWMTCGVCLHMFPTNIRCVASPIDI